MNTLLPRLVSVLMFVVIVGGFMTADKLWLHWYTPDTSTVSVGTKTVETNPGEAAQAAPTPGATAGGGWTPTAEQSRDAFAALWVASQKSTYTVRYETVSAGGERGNTYRIFNKPPLARVDTILPGASEPAAQVIDNGAGALVDCRSDAGQYRCVAMDALAAPLPLAVGPVVFPAPATFDSFDIAETENRTIAGRPARCFQLKAKQGVAEAESAYCFSFSEAPVPVYGSGSFGTAEATELSADVSEAGFSAATPSASGTATPGVTFTAVVGGPPGGTASASIQTIPGALCSITYTTPADADSADQGLVTKLADGSGVAAWSWKIGSRDRPGTGTVTVTCNGVQATADIGIG